ncbi:hypothetical protein V0288_23545 [Pannus brasiliensis CCIBt3594]|uniref:Uncharacterized protein n=1 Tax=Pannus brasiliensis CCIBt3594 TaxID=1427578 RepID=A0AAW9R1R8_9CHRO
MLISSFELLLKPRLPKALPPGIPVTIEKPSRNIIQGYCLKISNLNAFEIVLSLVFDTQLSDGITHHDFLAFFDVSGSGDRGVISADITETQLQFSSLRIPPLSTGHFFLQPNVLTKSDLLTRLDFEVRGFAEVYLSSLSGESTDVKIQVTPEQRGTFFSDFSNENSILKDSLDQIAYSLPVLNGGLVTLNRAGKTLDRPESKILSLCV